MNTLTVFNRPANKGVTTFPLTADQIAFRAEFAKALTEQIATNLTELGGFITPGNDADKGTIMVALTLPMPGITFVDAESGTEETTRPYNLNINAVLAAPKKDGETNDPAIPVRALTFAELRANQAKIKATKK